jgi:hypothetical protein
VLIDNITIAKNIEMKIYDDITQSVSNTSSVRLSKIIDANILLKLKAGILLTQ